MTRARNRRDPGSDPLLRDCPSCGATAGKGCNDVERDGQRIGLVSRFTRLVHAARLEENHGR